jgi:hypothetical protein
MKILFVTLCFFTFFTAASLAQAPVTQTGTGTVEAAPAPQTQPDSLQKSKSSLEGKRIVKAQGDLKQGVTAPKEQVTPNPPPAKKEDE